MPEADEKLCRFFDCYNGAPSPRIDISLSRKKLLAVLDA